MIYFILILFFTMFLYSNPTQEQFRSEINNRLCLDNYNTCHNYEECCSRKNFYKLGHAKQCIHVKRNQKCDIYRKKKKCVKTQTPMKKIYKPGYSFIPFNNWNSHRVPVCSGKDTIPQGSITNKRIYNSEKINNNLKHNKNETDHHKEYNDTFFSSLEKIVYSRLPLFHFKY